MAKLTNRSTIPSGMLHPAGLVETVVNPAVQATARPAGSLLAPSPGYDSIRRGKNRFQGKGPTGGFREWEYAEDVGGTGAALAVVPGETTSMKATEWLPTDADSMPEGAMIISDRGVSQEVGFATSLHEGYNTIPDMGDRHPSRPLSRMRLMSPIAAFREEYRESPAIAVTAGIAFILLVSVVARDAERRYGRYRGQGVGTNVTGVPAAGAGAAGDTAAQAANEIGNAANKAVQEIKTVTDEAVGAIRDVAQEAKNTVT